MKAVRLGHSAVPSSYDKLPSCWSRVPPSGTHRKAPRAAATTLLFVGRASFQINDYLALFLSHMQSFAEEESPVALEGALFRATLTWSFHRVIERRRTFNDS